MKAKFPGRCKRCREFFGVGQEIAWTPKGVFACPFCARYTDAELADNIHAAEDAAMDDEMDDPPH